MIPRDYITEWRGRAPWSEDFQVEQDLIISRALVEIFSDPVLAAAVALRGGTAAFVAEEDPSALEDALDLGLEDGLVGIDRPVDAEDPLVDTTDSRRIVAAFRKYIIDQIAEAASLGSTVHYIHSTALWFMFFPFGALRV